MGLIWEINLLLQNTMQLKVTQENALLYITGFYGQPNSDAVFKYPSNCGSTSRR
jgi:hypothetical protein